MITDAQIHLWPEDCAQYPWPAGSQPDLPEAMTAERFLSLMDAQGIDRAVIAPPAVAGFDPSYALDCAERFPERLAVTSRWDFSDEAGLGKLPSWLDRPGMIGIRIALLPSSVGDLDASGRLPDFFAAAEEYGIPLMVFAPGTLGEIEKAAKRHSKLKLVVDHANLVGSTAETVPEKIAELVKLARFDNVAVKLGALPQRSSEGHPYTDLYPSLNSLQKAFGAQRLMWASDLTTSLKTGAATYDQNIELIRSAYTDLSAEDMDWIMGLTVSTWFHWPEHGAK